MWLRVLISAGLGLGAGAAVCLAQGIPAANPAPTAAVVARARARWRTHRRRRERERMGAELEENMPMFMRRARAGRTVLEVIRSGAREARGSILVRELGTVLDAYAVGVPLETALRESYERLPDPTYGRFITALALSRETGGELGHGLGALERVVRERRELRARIGEETAEARYSAIIVACIPLAAAAFGLLGRGDMLTPLFEVGFGRAALAAAGSAWILGILLIHRILARAGRLAT